MNNPTIHPAGTLRLYQPSNGTEGDMFMAEWCQNCARLDVEGELFCDILARTHVFRITEPEYPAEWQYSNGGVPQCTAFTADQPPEPRCTDTPDLFERGME